MGEKKQYPLELLLMVTLIGCFYAGCKKNNMDSSINLKNIENQISSSDWQERNQGVQSLLSLNQQQGGMSKKLQNQIFLIFKDEIDHPKNFKSDYDQNKYQNYMEDITSLIVNQNLADGVPVLFEYLLQGGSIFNDAALMYLGDSSFNYLLDKTNSGTKKEQVLAVSQLSYWANPPQDSDHVDSQSIPPLSEQQKQKLKPVLIKIYENSQPALKYWTLRGLGAFQQDPNVKNKLVVSAMSGETETIRNQAKRILRSAK